MRLMSEQEQLTKWNAGFVDGDGCIASGLKKTDRLDVGYKADVSCIVENCYVAGLMDSDGSINMSISESERTPTGYIQQPRCMIGQNHTKSPLLDKLATFAESVGVNYSIQHKSIDGKENDRFRFVVKSPVHVKQYLNALRPHLVVKKKQAEIMLEDIIPLMERDEHLHRRGFLKLMNHVDRMNAHKGGNRGKYNLEYFEDMWGMSLE